MTRPYKQDEAKMGRASLFVMAILTVGSFVTGLSVGYDSARQKCERSKFVAPPPAVKMQDTP